MFKKIILFLALLVGLSLGAAARAQSDEIKTAPAISRACASGAFSVYVDCQTGAGVTQNAGPGRHRFALPPDGRSLKVLIDGGSGVYSVSAIMSDGRSVNVATYPAQGKAIALTSEAQSLGWTAEGLTARAPGIADNIKYPIAELGNCQDKESCRRYCETPENMMACVEYGSGRGMISAEEAARAKRVIPKIVAGQTPGGCKSKVECENYCQSDSSRFSECVAFAEETGVMPPEELAKVKKIAQALKSGANMPGGCKGKADCEAYCADTAHGEECLNFAEKAEILPPEEIAEARKVMEYLQKGETPGKCQTKADCQTYCEADEHFEECILFGEKIGAVSKEEAEMAHKVAGKGPGGCKGKDGCAQYCDLQEHAEECAKFALEKELVSEEEAEKIKQGSAELRSGLDKIPADARSEVETCLIGLMGADNFAKIQGGQDVFLTKNQGTGVGPCFDNTMDAYAAKKSQEGQGAASGGLPAGAPPTNIPQPPVNMGPPANVGPPADVPVSAPDNVGPPAGNSAPPAGYAPDAATCAEFQSVPSCDVVPENVRSLCEQCQ